MLPLLRGVSRSFYLSIRLLPPTLRQPIGVAYLLARTSDTIADSTDLPGEARLQSLRTFVELIEGSVPAARADELARVLAPLQRDDNERGLLAALPACLGLLNDLTQADQADTRALLRLITQGQSLDVERFETSTSGGALQTVSQLDEYTYLVAGSVGEFWTRLCFRHVPHFAELPEGEMRELGRSYGMGLQLVNILRDAGADLRAGRCYFPSDELAAAGLAPQDIATRPLLFALVRDRWLAKAQHGLAQGMRYANAVRGRRLRAAGVLPALIGARTLALLRLAGADALSHTVKVPRLEVRAILARTAFTLASRASVQAQFDQLGSAGWDNPRP